MQFKGKLVNRTCENSKKPNFGVNFVLFELNLRSKSFSGVLPLLDARLCHKLSLYAIQGKVMIQTQ